MIDGIIVLICFYLIIEAIIDVLMYFIDKKR